MNLLMAHPADLGPLLYVAIAGVLASGVWRYAALVVGGRLDPTHPAFEWARAVAAAIVAAQASILVVTPMGPLVDVALWIRVLAIVAGFLIYHFNDRSILYGVVAGDAVVLAGVLWG